MRAQSFMLYGVSLFLLCMINACGGSKPSAEKSNPPAPTSTSDQAVKPEEKAPTRVDTVNGSMQETKKPEYQSPQTAVSSQQTAGSFAVQAGAYKMQDNAERIAAIAKERFNRSVSVIYDNVSGLYKVMVGTFTTKEDARQFRDQMVQQFPADYKDAWVSEIAPK